MPMFILRSFMPAIIVFVIVTILLCLPGHTLPSTGGNWFQLYQVDKIIHVCLFASLVYSFSKPIQLKGILNAVIIYIYKLIAIIGIVYGIIIELVQKYLIAGRSFDGWDILADAIGCYIGYRIATYMLTKQKPPSISSLLDEAKEKAKQYIPKA